MQTKSVRLQEALIQEAETLAGGRSFSDILGEAFELWLRRARRAHEDELIAQSLAGLSASQLNDEQAMVEEAGRSARAIMEDLDGQPSPG